MANEYPYEIEVIDRGQTNNKQEVLLRIGPKGYVFLKNYKDIAADIYNMEVRPSDVYVASFPRSGTTLSQELVWLVVNDLDYETALNIPLTQRYVFLEYSQAFNEYRRERIYEANNGDAENLKQVELLLKPGPEVLENKPSPRFIKTHVPLSLLSPKALDAKMVYVARDPRDAIVSYYHFTNSMKYINIKGDFKEFWNAAINNLRPWTPYFDNVKEAWEKRNDPNLLFLFYEDMRKDLPSVIRRVADFFGKKYNEDQIALLCDHLSFDKFKNNPSVNYDLMKKLGFMYNDRDFIRSGKTGGWRDYFDEEMIAQADKWIHENLRDTDLRFPSMQ